MKPSRNGIEFLGLSSSSFRSQSLVRWVISALVAFAIGIIAWAPDPAAAALAEDFVSTQRLAPGQGFAGYRSQQWRQLSFAGGARTGPST